MIENFLNNNTLFYCEQHGWVAGKFGEIPPTGREVPSGYAKACKGKKYYINYCCGLRCTDTKPESMLEAYLRSSDEIGDN